MEKARPTKQCNLVSWHREQAQAPTQEAYIPGDLQCEVLTSTGQHCGNAQGTTRCRQYCNRVATNWHTRLLPVAQSLVRAERVVGRNIQTQEWTPILSAISNANVWERVTSNVVVELLAFAEPYPLYFGQAQIQPAVKENAVHVSIQVPSTNTDALHAIEAEINGVTGGGGCSIVVNRTDSNLIVAIPPSSALRVKHAVMIGVRLLLADLVARKKQQPFSFNARYRLPGLELKGVRPDSGGPAVTVRDIRFGGVDLFNPPAPDLDVD